MILPHDEILRLCEAVVSSGLAVSRAALLAGVEVHFVAGLPVAATPRDQILQDLSAMNAAGTLENGSVPLEAYLSNATHQARGCQEEVIFREALSRVPPPTRAGDRRPSSPDRDRSATIDPASEERLLDKYIAFLPRCDQLLRLPPTFGADRGLPIATMYVELAVSRAGLSPEPSRFGSGPTLAEALSERRRLRSSRKVSAEEAVTGRHRRVLILGEPGGGKTSLLKYAILQIAGGMWGGRKLPFFVPVRVYWDARAHWRGEKDLTLLRFVAHNIVSGSRSLSGYDWSPLATPWREREAARVDEVERQILAAAEADPRAVVFLLDALDEVAGDRDAATQIAAEIGRLGPGVGWVVTSRRAGFFGGLDEDARFDVLDLDDDGIEALVHNWFRQPEHAGSAASARSVLDQIFSNPRLHEMARTPFLLTALCYLAATSQDPLPLHRSTVYERIFRAAQTQLRARSRDDTRLPDEAIDHLARFAHRLYTVAAGAPRQLFSRDEWAAFPQETGQPPPDLQRHLGDSRLLDRWSWDGDFHLVHLTLHEYLVARHLATRPIEEAIAWRYRPSFRVVFRFLAGRLWASGRHDDFRLLVRSLLDPVDELGLLFIEAAHYLVEAGVEDSVAVLGYDLGERLFRLWEERSPYLGEAAAVALATLGPDAALDRAEEILASVGGAPLSSDEFLARARSGASLRSRAQEALRLAAEVRSRRAAHLLVDCLFAAEDEGLASQAAESLAHQRLRIGRDLVLERATKAQFSSREWRRACVFARYARHSVFVPWLLSQLGDSTSSPLPFEALGAVGDPSAAPRIAEWLERAPPDGEVVSAAIEALARIDHPRARSFLRASVADLSTPRGQLCAYHAAAAGHLTDAEVIELLKTEDHDLLYSILDALDDRAEAGSAPGPVVDLAIEALFDDEDLGPRAFSALCAISVARSAAGLGRTHIERWRRAAVAGPARFRAKAAVTLGRMSDRSSAAILLSLARSESEEMDVRVAAIGAVGRAAGSPENVDVLVELARHEYPEISAAAADALADADFTRLGELPPSVAVRLAMARAAAERGLLIFDRYYIDGGGMLHSWG